MIGDLKGLAEQILAIAMGKRRKKVRFWIIHEGPHGIEIGPEFFHAGIPGFRIWRLGVLRPVTAWPAGRFVFRIPAEFEHVPLRYTEMFKQFPGGMRRAGRLRASERYRNARDRLFEIGMRGAARKQLQKLIAKTADMIHDRMIVVRACG